MLADYRNKNLGIALIFMLLSGVISCLHGVGTGWDFLDYHFYNGYALLHHRLGFDLAAAGYWTYYNPLLDSLNYLMITTLPAMLTTFLLGTLCGLNLFFLYKITELVFSNSGTDKHFLIPISFVIAISAPFVIVSLGSVMNDSLSAVPFMIAIYMVLKFLAGKQSLWWMFIAGLFNGLAPALKLTNADYAFCLVLVTLLLSLSNPSRLKPAVILGFGSLFGFLLANGWWMLLLYQHYGNPVLPFYNEIFHSPYFANENMSANPGFLAHNVWQMLNIIFILTTTTQQVPGWLMKDWRFLFVFILSIGFLLLYVLQALRNKKVQTRNQLLNFLGLFWALSYVLFAFMLGNYRYTIVLELLSGVLIVGFYYELTLAQSFNQRMKDIFTIILTLVSCFIIWQTAYPAFNYARYQGQYLEVNVPSPLPQNAMIIITGPLQSFLTPYFPESIRFVRPYIFAQENDPSKKAIMLHRGPLYLLSYDSKGVTIPFIIEDNTSQVISDYHLHLLGSCQLLHTNVKWRSTFKLCPVKKTI